MQYAHNSYAIHMLSDATTYIHSNGSLRSWGAWITWIANREGDGPRKLVHRTLSSVAKLLLYVLRNRATRRDGDEGGRERGEDIGLQP